MFLDLLCISLKAHGLVHLALGRRLLAFGIMHTIIRIEAAPGREVEEVPDRAVGRQVATQSRQREPQSRHGAPQSRQSMPRY